MAYQYSQSFQGGLQALPAGYMEAATMPGRALAAGIESAGSSISDAIQRYSAKREESNFYDERIANMAGVLSSIPIGADPNSPEGQTVKHIMQISGAKDQQGLQDWISKAPEMSLGKKKALAADLSFAIDRYDNYKRSELDNKIKGLQIKEYAQKAVDRRALRDAMGYLNDPANLQTRAPGGEFTNEVPPGIDPATVQPNQKFFKPGPDIVTPKGYGNLSQEVRGKLLNSGASPEAIAQADAVLKTAGFEKPLSVQEATTSDGFKVVRADGKIDILPPPKPIEGKPLNEYQSKAITFSRAMEENGKTIERLMAEGHKPTRDFPGAPDIKKSQNRKMYEAAQNAWVENLLRFKSGGVITKSEIENDAKTYFPQYGDGDAVIKQKEIMRKVAIESIREPLRQAGLESYFNRPTIGTYDPMSKKLNETH